MKNMRSIISLILIILLSFSLAAAAQQEDQVEEVSEPEANEQAVYINADKLDYQEEKTLLSGGVKITKGDTIINALNGELFREEQRMILRDEIDVEYPDGKVTSDLLTAYLQEEEYEFEDNVTLNYQLSEGEMLLTSSYLNIFGENNSFHAEENVEIDYDEQKFRGDQADYDGQTEMMILTGNVEIEEGQDWVRSDRATFNLAEGEEGYTAEGNVEIRMILD
jgi:lipopolysaccharide export system protein LptA